MIDGNDFNNFKGYLFSNHYFSTGQMASVGLSRMIIDNQELGWSAIARQRYWCSSYPKKYVQYFGKILLFVLFDPLKPPLPPVSPTSVCY